jgi:hypothetical protein
MGRPRGPGAVLQAAPAYTFSGRCTSPSFQDKVPGPGTYQPRLSSSTFLSSRGTGFGTSGRLSAYGERACVQFVDTTMLCYSSYCQSGFSFRKPVLVRAGGQRGLGASEQLHSTSDVHPSPIACSVPSPAPLTTALSAGCRRLVCISSRV